MWGAILGIVSWVLGKLFGGSGETQEAVQAAAAASAQTTATTDAAAVKTVQAEAQAVEDAPRSQSELGAALGNGTF